MKKIESDSLLSGSLLYLVLTGYIATVYVGVLTIIYLGGILKFHGSLNIPW